MTSVRSEASARGLRVLYIGELWEGGTCLERMRALQRLGAEVFGIDVSEHVARQPRILRSIASRLAIGPSVWHANRALQDATRRSHRIDVIWVDKGVWIAPETLRAVKRTTDALLVHYTPDPALVHHRTRQFVAALPYYDLAFTTKPHELELYRRAGARRVILVDHSFSAGRFFPRRLDEGALARYGAAVTFIGHYERHYARLIRYALRAGIRIRVWGPGWRRQTYWQPWLRQVVAGGPIYGEDYPVALCAASIGVGFLSKLALDTTTTRTFEIPACGTFMLAERTPDHLRLFREGVEADFFSSDLEFVEKLRFYTDDRNRERRAAIAAAGRQRCILSGYSDDHRIAEMLECVTGLRGTVKEAQS